MDTASRIKDAMTKAGIASAAELARRAGINEVTARAYISGARKLSSYAAAAKIALALGVEIPQLLGDLRRDRTPASNLSVASVPVRGVVQAGVWREYEEFDYAEIPPIPIIPGKFPLSDQFAFRVAGDSVNKLRIFDGDFVICVPYWLARSQATTGDIVVVERREGPRMERTVKRLLVVDGGCELWPDSTNPIHSKPIFVQRNNGFSEGEGMEIEITGLVIGRYSPM